MQIKVKKLCDSAVIPQYKSEGAAGFDLSAAVDVRVASFGTEAIPTGLAFEIPIGYEMQIRPRSGVSLKTPLIIKNSPGTIDSDYRGDVKIIVYNLSNKPFFISKGFRLAQGVIVPVASADIVVTGEIGETKRGGDGLGSSGFF